MQSSITLRKGTHGPPELTLPLANTLFRTGRLSTLLVSRWKYDAEKADFVTIRAPVERTNVAVNMLQDVYQRIPWTFMPAVPITPARPIVNGLGNIVRTVDFGGDEGHGPASRELEATVTKYLDVMGYGNTTIDVWALIVPPESIPHRIKSGLPYDKPHPLALSIAADKVQSKWQDNVELGEESDYVGFWIKTGNAKFCRVRK